MTHSGARRSVRAGASAALLLLGCWNTGWACDGPKSSREATVAEIRDYFAAQKKAVLTLVGYSGAGYEDEAALVEHSTALLDGADPASTIVNIGATPDGIGAAYELAKRKGFATTGIVSTQARESKASISPCVDTVFFVKDATWGGFLENTGELSPTSAAIVEVSDRLVAIGGGDVARDELVAAKRAGRDIRFIPADMNHRIARERAAKRGEAPPTDFRGAAHAVFGGGAGMER